MFPVAMVTAFLNFGLFHILLSEVHSMIVWFYPPIVVLRHSCHSYMECNMFNGIQWWTPYCPQEASRWEMFLAWSYSYPACHNIYNILQYTFYLNRVSWPYKITQQQMITGNVAMVTKGTPTLTWLEIVIFFQGFPIILQLWQVNINVNLLILWFDGHLFCIYIMNWQGN